MCRCELVGLGVDDTPDFFYDKIDGIYGRMGLTPEMRSRGEMQSRGEMLPSSRELLRLEDHVGAGYAESTAEELDFLVEVAQATGICLDPVYSGKAALGMVEDLHKRPGAKRVCFIHTGGMLGLYAKESMLLPLLQKSEASQ